MLEVKVPKEIPEIIEPKIPLTNIPNPLGTARLIYKNGGQRCPKEDNNIY